MYPFITVLIIIACILLMVVVLIQNPKGGGLGQAFGGLSNQFLGVQRTTDFLEKSTWVLIGAVALLSISTLFFVGKTSATQPVQKSEFEGGDLGGSQPVPNNNATPITAPDSSK
ncbi:MAG TPA: preprotein translocase subunit SecG [Chitinophagales bacterium]|nr:preprotein translocase subunit SecG [Chitinophagales bacterium]